MSDSAHVQYLDIKMGTIDENVADLAYIEQTLKLVNAIPLGSIPMMPLSGSPVPMMVDSPVNGEFVATVTGGTYEATKDLFPDVKIKSVTINSDDDGIVNIVPNFEYTGDLKR